MKNCKKEYKQNNDIKNKVLLDTFTVLNILCILDLNNTPVYIYTATKL